MMYKYLAYLLYLPLAYYAARVICIKLAQWWRREDGGVHLFAEVLLSKCFGKRALDASYQENVVWHKRQVLACYGLVVLTGAIVVGDMWHYIVNSMVNQVVASGQIDPATGKPLQPLTAAEHQQLWSEAALIGAGIATVVCVLHFAAMKVAWWYCRHERLNPFSLAELRAWEQSRKLRSDTDS